MDEKQLQLIRVVQQFNLVRWGAALEETTHGEYSALYAIDCAHALQPDKPGVYVSALADRLKISVSMASKSLKALEEKGWVLRIVDPNSRRNTFVCLTDAGKACLAREITRTCAVNQQVFDRMGPERMSRFLEDAALLAASYADILGTK